MRQNEAKKRCKIVLFIFVRGVDRKYLRCETGDMLNTDKLVTDLGKAPSVKYTINDVGCYVESARGTYAIDKIASLARAHGFELESDLEAFVTLSDYEFAGELEDEIDSFMNDKYGVEGAYWGRNENSDWGLWEVDDYSQHAVN